MSGVAAIAAGGDHTCAYLTGGTVECCGDNSVGQLGDGTTTSSTMPVPVSF
jgi:alpha-tubulin suppressor-like RCC1 family protein